MIIRDLLYKVAIEQVIGNTSNEIKQIQFDSRKVQAGDMFVAISGTVVDGHNFIEKAIELGAVAILCEQLPTEAKDGVTYIRTPNSAKALGIAASNYYGNPTQKLTLVGITGTNGKTTTTTLLYQLFQNLGKPSVLVSTIRILMNDKQIQTTHTTPDILTLNKIFKEAVEAGCEYAFMEVSSHGIHQERIAGLDFDFAGFTNITHDHLDYHGTFKNYINAKKKFFDDLKPKAIAISNIDDKNGMVMLQNTKAQQKTYALRTMADFKAKIIESQFDGMLLEFNGKEFWTPLIGKFNAYNLLLVFGIANLCGLDDLELLTEISKLGNVDGRFQVFHSAGQIVTIVDYAHTPDALENVLNTIDSIRSKNENLYTIVGCGGDRDKEKRPEMARIAVQNSDKVIFTSDNPRTEDPYLILEDMEKGVTAKNAHKTLKIENRKEAIKTAFSLANPKDIILIAGKGHENYQEINGVRHSFNDFKIAQEISKQLKK